jgi:hypothetical protein
MVAAVADVSRDAPSLAEFAVRTRVSAGEGGAREWPRRLGGGPVSRNVRSGAEIGSVAPGPGPRCGTCGPDVLP